MPGLVHVVDDDASLRVAVERRLGQAGYEVTTYASAEEFLDRLPSEAVPSCILLDVRLLGMTGLELQSRLRETRLNAANHIPHRARRHRADGKSRKGWRT